MTFFEKWKEEHPGEAVFRGYPPCCPYGYKYEEKYDCTGVSCRACWEREIPEEPKADKKMIYAHMGFSEEQAEAIEEMNEGKKTPNDVREIFGLPRILDSGARREFGTGAVRDIQEGKGRMDLVPLAVASVIISDTREVYKFDPVLDYLDKFQKDGYVSHLYRALDEMAIRMFNRNGVLGISCCNMVLEVSRQFEEGAKKYGERNWEKGIPVHCYIDSAARHYLKWLRGDNDEPHDRAAAWNLMCCIWTVLRYPELNDYAKRDISDVEEALG